MPQLAPNLTTTSTDPQLVRLFFGTGFAASLALALLYLLLPPLAAPGMQPLVIGLSLVCAGAYAVGGGLIDRAGLTPATRFTGWATLLLILASAGFLDERVRLVLCGLAALVIAVCGVTIRLRTAFAMALTTGAGLTAIELAFESGRLASVGRADAAPAMVAGYGLLLGASVSVAALLSRIVARYSAAVADRDSHFRRLLQIAADGYWEFDATLRLARIEPIPMSDGETDPFSLATGLPVWELPNVEFDLDVLDRHRADLESRLAFRHLPLRVRTRDGQSRHLLLSGEPRFDDAGVFLGYWGVIRDATAEVVAQQATAASDRRYRELFERCPSPLVLHRRNRVIDANPAALALFGVARLEGFVGQDLLDFDANPEERALSQQRVDRLERARVGESVPARSVALRSAGGQPLDVLATAVKVAMPDGAATLSLFFDETERRRADDALRRSQALLANLVATTPDLISLSELESGRYVMVNPAFSRVLGWEEAELVGRSELEAGIWHDRRDRERLVQQVCADQRVDGMPTVFVARDGRLVPALVSAARFELDGHAHLVVVTRDMSANERTRLELEAILRSASTGIAFVRGRQLVRVNHHFADMFGWQEDALVGQPGQVLWASDEEFAAVGAIARPLLAAGQAFEIERLMKQRDGSTFWCRLRARAIDPARPSHAGTIWIAEDITERRQTEQALAAARDAAEAANRAKSAFLANTSHEIRTPLNGLLGLAQLALRPTLADAERQVLLQQILGSAQTLSGLISDILDLSKIEAGKLTLETLDFDLHALLGDIDRGYQPLAEQHGLALSVTLAPDVPRRVRGDPLRVRQILSNYLTNAIKFTARGSVALVVGGGRAPLLHFEVRDTGSGIAPDTLQRLFRPFTQADDSTTRRYGGTGLGLSICRELAELMGGRVGADSEVGAGSRFWAELPLPAAPDAPPAPEAPARPVALAGLRVLVVEDNPVNMMIAAATLQPWGVDVLQAGDGAAALDVFDAAVTAGTPPDVVLMDLQMPGMSGHDAARRLRERPAGARVPIIALTAAALVSEREAAREAGMVDFLTKPLDSGRLHAALARTRTGRAARRR